MIRTPLLAAVAAVSIAASTHAAVVITEAHPTGSSSTTYGRDWFEVTNTGAAALDLTSWKIDDSSAAIGTAAALRGVASIPAGKSAIFMESTAIAGDDDLFKASFIAAWFGVTPPANLLIGFYSGSGLGLSSSGDEVNLFDSTDALAASVAFGAGTPGTSFDNASATTSLPKVTISNLSVVGTNGAFNSVAGSEIGSPGAIPEPASLGLICVASIMGLRRRGR